MARVGPALATQAGPATTRTPPQSPTAGDELPVRPGTIVYFDEDGRQKGGAETFTSELTRNWKPTDERGRETSLGQNLYNKERRRAGVSKATRTETQQLVAEAKETASSSARGSKSEQKADSKAQAKPTRQSTATAELNMLAQMMGTVAAETEQDTDSKSMPKLNLFADDFNTSSSSIGGGASADTITIDGSRGRQTAASLMADLKFDEDEVEHKAVAGDKKAAADDEDDDDLLALMDGAGD